MSQLINESLIFLDVEANTKDELIEKMASAIQEEDRLYDIKDFVSAVNEREKLFPTAIGFDFAIPHGKSDSVKDATIAFARLKKSILWSEEEEAQFVFMIAVPEKQAGDEHLRILSQLSRAIMREEFRESIKSSTSTKEVLALLEI